MKKVLGLDIGTNSIGWALVEMDFENMDGNILDMGCRVVPMDADLLKNFEQGNTISRTGGRRLSRGIRRLNHRYKLRRERLIKSMKVLGWIPSGFPEKFDGLSCHNINQFLPFSDQSKAECAELLQIHQESLPHDWVIYYLRKKALHQRIELPELARILYHLNQRRGFKSNRKANDESTTTIDDLQGETVLPKNESWVEIFKITSLIDTHELSRGKKVIQITTDKEIADGLNSGTITRQFIPNWVNTEQELQVKVKRSKQGTKIEFSIPDKSEWKKSKEALENNIEESGMQVGEYFLSQLINDPNYRIRQKVIDRTFYIDEISAIWQAQSRYHKELTDKTKLKDIALLLYPHNKEKQKELNANDLFHLFIHDIIYYQRPLKSQRASVGDCRVEKKNVTISTKRKADFQPALKAAPASCPLFQEFRIWKTIHNLKVLRIKKTIGGKIYTDFDETDLYLDLAKKAQLFEYFDQRDQVRASSLLRFLQLSPNEYKLNYPEDTLFPGNETKQFFNKALAKLGYQEGSQVLENKSQLNQLWHLFYSVEQSHAIEKSLISRFGFPQSVAKNLAVLPPFTSKYAAYSQKALRRLLTLLRSGQYWSYDKIDPLTQSRIQKLITAEDDPEVNIQTREKLQTLDSEEKFQGLPEWMATYVVYGQHSEREGEIVEHPSMVKVPMQNSLRNPIVEQLINETMQLCKAIWQNYGRPDEIRVEMARDMTRSAKEREKLSKIRDKNRDDKIRIKAILRELNLGNPESITDVEKLRLLEENANFQWADKKDSFFKKSVEPSTSEIQKYKLWMEQNCVSPYTGKPIMLSRLYTRDYEVEHIIPRSKFFDDSMGNKIISETWANTEKGNLTAMQYIRRGSSLGSLLSVENYIAHVNKLYNGKKRKHLLSDTVPESFIERQLNDTRYITKQVLFYLTQIVPKEKVRVTLGQITNELKHRWGLNETMKRILVPRFERLQEISGERLIEHETTQEGQRKIHLQGYEKRIDHRHHSLDALIVACTTNSHIQYLSNLKSGSDPNTYFKFKKLLNSPKTRDFRLPWRSFIPDSARALNQIIVSHKNRNRILNKGVNKYIKFVWEKDTWVKKPVFQETSGLYSIRQPLHKATIHGTVKLRKYKNVGLLQAIQKVDYIADKRVKTALKQLIEETNGDIRLIKQEIRKHPIVDKNDAPVTNRITIWYFEKFSVSREKLDNTFTEEKINNKIAEYDSTKEKGIKSILLRHLSEFENDPKKAFAGEGLEALWKRTGKTLTTVSTYEPIGKKFEIRSNQLVEAAKGTNLFFVIYENTTTGEREFETPRLDEVIAAKMQKLPIVKPREGLRHFTLSPNDLVYVPEENENIRLIDWDNERERISRRIYKVVSATGSQCFFVPNDSARVIMEKVEYGSMNKSERDLQGKMIKQSCIKLKHDRMGKVQPIKI